jgi:hypothetical protein
MVLYLRYTGDNENRMQAVIGSEVTFTLVENAAQHSLFITALATSQDPEFTLSIYKDPDNTNVLLWTGVLLSEQIELLDQAYPIMNTFTAVDELGNLKNILYNDDGVKYTGRDNIAVHIAKAILKTRALHIYDSTDFIIQYANNFYPTTDFSSTNALIEARVDHSAFYNADDEGNAEYFSAFEVLESICITFNARLFFAEGYFHFIPVGAPADSYNISLFTVTKAGTVSATASTYNTRLVIGTDIMRLNGGVTTFLPPLDKVRRTWIINANFPVLYGANLYLNPAGTQNNITDPVTDANLTYENETTFRFTFRYSHSYPGNGTSTLANVPARIVLRFQIKCGSLYYSNAVTFGPETYTTGSYEYAYEMENMTFSEPAWTTTPSQFFVAVTPTPVYIDRNNGAVINGGIYDSQFGAYVVSLGEYDWIQIDFSGITSQQTGLEIVTGVLGYDYAGTLISDVTDSTAYGKMHGMAVYVLNGNLTNGDQVIYEANTNDAGQLTYDQGDVQIGSAGFDDLRNIYENISSPGQVINEWGCLSDATADLPIHQLGVREVIKGQNLSTRVRRGSIYGAFVSPLNTMLFTARYYLPFQIP